MEEFKGPDTGSKEGVKIPAVFIVYRENELFNKYILGVIETLKSLGRDVEIKSYSADLNRDQVKESLKNEGIEDMEKRRRKGELVILGDESSGYGELDQLFNKAALLTVMGKDFINSEGRLTGARGEHLTDPELIKQGYEKIVRAILSDKGKTPQQVFILTNKILEHAPKVIKDESEMARNLKDWISIAGIESGKIQIPPDGKFNEYMNEEGTWIIADRHYLSTHKKGEIRDSDRNQFPHTAKLLQVPLSNFYTCAKEEGLLEFPDDLSSSLKETIIREYGQKEE